jgi:hypothetical protein
MDLAYRTQTVPQHRVKTSTCYKTLQIKKTGKRMCRITAKGRGERSDDGAGVKRVAKRDGKEKVEDG